MEDKELELALGRMTLGEREAFERGKRHAVRTLAAATKKVLDAASVEQLITALRQPTSRIEEVKLATKKPWLNDDPTEPAAWEPITPELREPARRILGRSPVADVKDHLARFEHLADFTAYIEPEVRLGMAMHLARPGEMAMAAACYAERAFGQIRGDGAEGPPPRWPFHRDTWRNETPIKNLEKAARLLACEIDQLRYLAALPNCPACRHQPHLPGQCMNMASDGGCGCRQPESWARVWLPTDGHHTGQQVGTRPGDEDRHTVGEHR